MISRFFLLAACLCALLTVSQADTVVGNPGYILKTRNESFIWTVVMFIPRLLMLPWNIFSYSAGYHETGGILAGLGWKEQTYSGPLASRLMKGETQGSDMTWTGLGVLSTAIWVGTLGYFGYPMYREYVDTCTDNEWVDWIDPLQLGKDARDKKKEDDEKQQKPPNFWDDFGMIIILAVSGVLIFVIGFLTYIFLFSDDESDADIENGLYRNDDDQQPPMGYVGDPDGITPDGSPNASPQASPQVSPKASVEADDYAPKDVVISVRDSDEEDDPVDPPQQAMPAADDPDDPPEFRKSEASAGTYVAPPGLMGGGGDDSSSEAPPDPPRMSAAPPADDDSDFGSAMGNPMADPANLAYNSRSGSFASDHGDGAMPGGDMPRGSSIGNFSGGDNGFGGDAASIAS